MSSPPQRASEQTRNKWQASITRWQQSGVPARVFASQEGISEASLYVWRRFFRAFASPPTPHTPPSPAFVQLKLTDATLCEIPLPSGVLLRLPLGTDPTLISAWIRAACEVTR